MSKGNEFSKSVDAKESLAATPLSADGGHSLKVPSCKGLVNAAKAKDFILPSFGLLVYVLNHHVQKAERDRSCDERDQGVLLELIVEDRGVALSFRSNRHPLFGVLHSNVEAGSGGSNLHGGDTESSREQSLRNKEEAAVDVLDV